MCESARKDEFKRHIKRYTDEITENGVLKKKRASQFVDAITCPPLTINGEELHSFACAIGDCAQCKIGITPLHTRLDVMITYGTACIHQHISARGMGIDL